MKVREAIALAAHVATSRSPVPILTCVRIAGGRVTATDATQQIEIPVELPKALKKAAFCVQAARLARVLKALPDNVEIDLAIAEGKLVIQGGATRYELNTRPTDDFPAMREEPEDAAELQVLAKDLIAALSFVQSAAAGNDEIPYYLRGVHLQVHPERLVLTATDGKRLHRTVCPVAAGADGSGLEAILPIAAVARVIEVAGSHKDLTLRLDRSNIVIEAGETISAKLIDGKFPQAERVIPKQRPVTASLPREGFAEALQRVAQIHAAARSFGVTLDFQPDHISVSAVNAEGERALERFEWNVTGAKLEPIVASFNHAYLLDALGAFQGELVFLHLGREEKDSVYLTDADDGKCDAVIMPARL